MPRAQGGPDRSRIVALGDFNTRCGSAIGPHLVLTYGETVRVLGPPPHGRLPDADEDSLAGDEEGGGKDMAARWQAFEVEQRMGPGGGSTGRSGTRPLTASGPA